MEYLEPKDFELAAQNGITEVRLKHRFYQLGWSKRRAITQPCKSPQGLWPKFKDLCKENRVSQTTFFRRINETGLTPEQAATTPPGTLSGRNAVLTKEVREIADKNGISKGALHYRVYGLKWSVERAMTEPIHTEKRRMKDRETNRTGSLR